MGEEVNNRLIELTDEESGEKVMFEHLDSVDYDDSNYFVLTEYDEKGMDSEKEFDVYIMKLVTEEDGGEALEVVEDDTIINNVFNVFKSNAKDDFEFID